MSSGGGRYDFDDGGSYCGGWEDGKAHGQGVCTGPKGQGEYSGAWAFGFEASGLYVWPSGNMYGGEWLQGKRHGVGVEKKDKWTYRGEWTHGFKGRYGVRQSVASGARYEGTWANGLQDGYGCETYADGGTYQGQWQRGTRHGYGVRQSVSYGLAATYRARTLRASQQSLHSEEEDDRVVKQRDKKLDETRGGFILTARSNGDAQGAEAAPHCGEPRRASRLASLLAKPKTIKRSLLTGLRLRKQRSAGDVNELHADAAYAAVAASMRSARSFASQRSTSSVESAAESRVLTDVSDDRSFYSQDDIADSNVTEMYMGEWSGDKRSGFGVSERSDGLKYEGEWYNNKKYGYGVTTFKDGGREDGKYKNNSLVSSAETTNRLLLVQRTKLRERVETSALAARRAAQLALQKADIAMSRMANARAKAELADAAADKARQDSEAARVKAAELDPKFHQPGLAILKTKRLDGGGSNGPVSSAESDIPKFRSASAAASLPRHVYKLEAVGNGGDPSVLLGRHSLSGATDRGMGKDSVPNGRLRKLAEVSSLDSAYGLLGAPGGDTLADGAKASLKPSSLLSQSVLSDHFDHYLATRRPATDATDENHNRTVGVVASCGAQTSVVTSATAREAPPPPSRSAAAGGRRTSGGAPAAVVKGAPPAVRLDHCAAAGPVDVPDKGGHQARESAAAPPRRVEDFSMNALSKDDAALLKSTKAKVALAAGGRPSLSASKQTGSLPDISAIREIASMSKDEVLKLSAERREAVRRLLDENERRRNGDLSMLVSDVKKWVQQRQLMMLVFAINLSVASVIYNLML